MFDLSVCLRTYPPYLNKFFIPRLITEAIGIILVLRVGIKNMRRNGGIEISNSLLHILVKNSIFHFFV